MKREYTDFLGITKKDLVADIGDQFNFYPDDLWVYLIHQNFFGRKTFLIIEFDNDIVVRVTIKKTYGSIKKT